jgi:hypothetical protein
MLLRLTVGVCTALLSATLAHAQLWQCPKPEGGYSYQDKPCAKASAPASTPVQPPPTKSEPILQKGTLVCLTAMHFNQAVEAQEKKDVRGFTYLLEKKICIVTGRDLPVSLLYDSPRGPSQIRLYSEDGKAAHVFWTDSVFIRH